MFDFNDPGNTGSLKSDRKRGMMKKIRDGRMRYQSLQSVTVNLMVPLLPLPVLQNQLCMMWLKITIP